MPEFSPPFAGTLLSVRHFVARNRPGSKRGIDRNSTEILSDRGRSGSGTVIDDLGRNLSIFRVESIAT